MTARSRACWPVANKITPANAGNALGPASLSSIVGWLRFIAGVSGAGSLFRDLYVYVD